MTVRRNVVFRFRQNTEDALLERNATYAEGEPIAVLLPNGGIRLKIGDGIRQFNDLPYVLAPVGDVPEVGDLSELTTDDKTSLVAAINELNAAGVSFALLYDNAKAG